MSGKSVKKALDTTKETPITEFYSPEWGRLHRSSYRLTLLHLGNPLNISQIQKLKSFTTVLPTPSQNFLYFFQHASSLWDHIFSPECPKTIVSQIQTRKHIWRGFFHLFNNWDHTNFSSISSFPTLPLFRRPLQPANHSYLHYIHDTMPNYIAIARIWCQ